MKAKLQLIAVALFAVFGMFFASPVVSADATDVFTQACQKSKDNPAVCASNGNGLFDVIRTVIQVMLVIGGIIAVIMIILGGIRYVTSNGDQADVKAAKDTILYAVIGLIVAAMAYAIVTWVVGYF